MNNARSIKAADKCLILLLNFLDGKDILEDDVRECVHLLTELRSELSLRGLKVYDPDDLIAMAENKKCACGKCEHILPFVNNKKILFDNDDDFDGAA